MMANGQYNYHPLFATPLAAASIALASLKNVVKLLPNESLPDTT